MSPIRALALAVVAVSGLAPAVRAGACSLCACGDPLLAASDPAAMTGTLRLQLDAEHQRVRAGSEGTPGATDELTQWSYRLNVAYRPTERVSLSATLPVVSKVLRTLDAGPDAPESRLTRLGDLELAGRWAVLRTESLGRGRVHELAVTGGASVPTGESRAVVGGARVDPHGQVGSGAWGPFVGLAYLVEQGRWLAFASASHRYRTEASLADGAAYRFGAAWLWSAHAQVRPVRALALDLGVDGRSVRADRATDADGAVEPAVENTGGTVLALAPGVYAHAGGGAWLFARAQLPVVKRLRGEQDVLPSLAFGVQLQAR